MRISLLILLLLSAAIAKASCTNKLTLTQDQKTDIWGIKLVRLCIKDEVEVLAYCNKYKNDTNPLIKNTLPQVCGKKDNGNK